MRPRTPETEEELRRALLRGREMQAREAARREGIEALRDSGVLTPARAKELLKDSGHCAGKRAGRIRGG